MNIENITLGQIGIAIAFLVALVAGGIKIKNGVKKWMTDILKDSFDETKKEIKGVKDAVEEVDLKVSKVDMEQTKNFLTTTLAEISRGEVKSDIEIQRLKEQYDHYTNVLHGNTYVKDEYEKLKAKNWL